MNESLTNLAIEITRAEQVEDAALKEIEGRPLPIIDCVNESSVVTDADCLSYVKAVQIQISRDFFPHWGIEARLHFIPKGGKPDPARWWMIVGDTSDQVQVLGYHTLSNTGLPLGFVFAKSDLDTGASVSVTLSHEVCLTGDTKIPLLDGTESAIKDLIGREYFWVYSCENGLIRAGRGHSARITKKNAPLVAVTLDNGEVVRCTSDHPFLMRDGTYREAQNLVSGDSLMPLYRRIKTKRAKVGKPVYDYEQVYVPAENRWRFTHQVICQAPSGFDAHHKNENRFNNNPENLEALTAGDHFKEHDAKRRKHNKQWNSQAVADGSHPFLKPHSSELIAINAAKITEYNKSQKHREDMARYFSRPGTREAAGARLRIYASSEANKLRSKIESNRPERLAASGKIAILNNHVRWHLKRGISKSTCSICVKEAIKNHKVVSVFPAGREDVYDLTVENYHNFGLSAGVFVHNCEMILDPCINLTAQLDDTRFAAYEVADPVEADSDGYLIGNVLVSNFVLPSYFSPGHAGPWDFKGLLNGGMPTLRPNGYLSIYTAGLGWGQIDAATNAKMKMKAIPHVGSRRQRRATPRANWVRSEVKL